MKLRFEFMSMLTPFHHFDVCILDLPSTVDISRYCSGYAVYPVILNEGLGKINPLIRSHSSTLSESLVSNSDPFQRFDHGTLSPIASFLAKCGHVCTNTMHKREH